MKSGTGRVSFSNCHFIGWDKKRKGEPAIYINGGGLSIVGSDFMDTNKNQVVIDKGTVEAVIVGNRLRGGEKVINKGEAEVQIGLNTYGVPGVEKGAIIIDDSSCDGSFAANGAWCSSSNGGSYLDSVSWACKGSGESKVTWTPNIPDEGIYAVSLWYGDDPNDDHATDASFTVNFKGGSKDFKINLKENQKQWRLLGEFKFSKGKSGSVVLTNKANGNVVADAMKFMPVK